MTDEQALLRTIVAHPADDLPRLVFADFIEEGGDAARAEFIRVQCEICRLMMWRLPHNGGTSTGRDLAAERRASLKTLRERERELWKSAKHAWFPQIEGENHLLRHTEECSGRIFGGSIVDAVECSFLRGFVESVRLPLAAFLGGSCERCGGTGFPGGEPSHMMEHSPRLCRYCLATGRTEGIAKRLFESQPCVKVEFTDREPEESAQHPGWFRWWSWADPDNAAVIGYDLYKRLRSDFSISDYQPYFSTPDLAITALSDAAVALGRSLADLPPLRATPPAEARHTLPQSSA